MCMYIIISILTVGLEDRLYLHTATLGYKTNFEILALLDCVLVYVCVRDLFLF